MEPSLIVYQLLSKRLRTKETTSVSIMWNPLNYSNVHVQIFYLNPSISTEYCLFKSCIKLLFLYIINPFNCFYILFELQYFKRIFNSLTTLLILVDFKWHQLTLKILYFSCLFKSCVKLLFIYIIKPFNCFCFILSYSFLRLLYVGILHRILLGNSRLF